MILSEHDRQVLEALEWAESGIAGQLTFDFQEIVGILETEAATFKFEKAGGVQKEAPPFYGKAPTLVMTSFPLGGFIVEAGSSLADDAV